MSDLTPLLNPRSVAVVGASDDPAKWGFGIARGVLRGADRRRVELVNARSPTVQGHADGGVAARPRRTRRPGGAGGAGAAPSRRSSRTAWRAACGRSSASRSASPRPGRRDVRSRSAWPARVREAGAVLLGPNCMGVWSGHESFDAAWLDNGQVPGPLALVSQSGGLGVDFASYGIEMGLGMSHFVSVGNQADVTVGDVVSHLAGDPLVRAIGVYCEDFRDGRGFLRAVAEAREAGKPVIVLSPTGEPAARAAQSHTGSLVSTPARRVGRARRRRRAAGGDAGGADGGRAGPADARTRPRGRRVAVLSDGGGIAVIATGVLAADGFVRARAVRPASRRGCASCGRVAASTSQPDRPDGRVRRHDTYPRVLDLLVASGEVDATVLVGSFGTMTHEEPGRLDETEAAAAMAAAGHPLVAAVQWIDEPPWRALRDGGVPAFRRVGSACRALAAAYRFASAEVRVTPGVAGARGAGPATRATWRRARCWPAGGCRSREAEEVTGRRGGAGGRRADRLPGGAEGARRRAQVGRRRRGARPRRRPRRSAAAIADLRRGSTRRRSASSGWWRRRHRPSWSAA